MNEMREIKLEYEINKYKFNYVINLQKTYDHFTITELYKSICE